MSQNDLSIANQGFASFRSDLNSALQALGSTNSGTSAPSTTYANQLFYDTTNNILKIRNEDNDAFISLFTLDQTNDNIESLTINGALTADSLSVDNITIDGTEIDLSSGDLTIDVAGDLIIDVDDAEIIFKDGGTQIGRIRNVSSGEFTFQADVQDKDIVFNGNDGGSTVTALTLDMSDAGTAIFNHDIALGDDQFIFLGTGQDMTLRGDGTNGVLTAPNGDLTIDVAGDIILDADGGDIKLKDGGTGFANFSVDNTGLTIVTTASDADFKINGVDGGANITALTLDMSDGGTATFNSGISASGELDISSSSSTSTISATATGSANLVMGTNFSGSASQGMPNQVGFINMRQGFPIVFGTAETERARILGPSTSHSGFFKISDNGNYRASTTAFHEIQSSSSGQPNINFGMTHASFAGTGVQVVATRAASGGDFIMYEAFSGNGADREFRVDSDGTTHADGSYSSSGGDYAEMFEWSDGNTSNEDRVGKTVVLEGNQIRLSTSDDAQATIIGVVSATPVVLGDAQSEKWKDKYETDDYGRYVFEDYTQTEWTVEVEDGAKEKRSYQTDMIPSDVTVPDDAIVTSKDENDNNLKRRKLNTAFDPSQTYIPREKRKEFSPIGLVGKLKVNVGQTIGDRWIKMREISDTVHEYLVR